MATATPRARPKVMSLTDAAVARVRDIIARSDKPVLGLRVGVKKSSELPWTNQSLNRFTSRTVYTIFA